MIAGWTEGCYDETLEPYYSRGDELSCKQVVSFGTAGSPSHHNVGATALGTPGICGMKTIARAYTWWPKLDQEIEKAVRVCTIYQNIRNSPFSAPLTTEKKKQSTDLI